MWEAVFSHFVPFFGWHFWATDLSMASSVDVFPFSCRSSNIVCVRYAIFIIYLCEQALAKWDLVFIFHPLKPSKIRKSLSGPLSLSLCVDLSVFWHDIYANRRSDWMRASPSNAVCLELLSAQSHSNRVYRFMLYARLFICLDACISTRQITYTFLLSSYE